MLGEMADELLLASAKVEPAKLEEHGYSFRVPEIEASLRRAVE
jgi:NAD dependent epimerase/dehydratase family enzyme